jgi:predicted ATPase
LAAGLTHEALAERARVSARAISDLERGVSRAPHAETLALLVRALSLTPQQQGALAAAARRTQQDDFAEPPNQLPVQLTRFVGRELEMQAAADYLRRQDVRLLTVTGPGGAGKSRFAIELALNVLPVFPGGARFVALAPVASSQQVTPAIARALGAVDADQRTTPDTLIDLLDNRGCLLLLDNFEHLLDSAPLVVELVRGDSRIKILTTSRAPLRVSGEQVFPLLPLPIPDAERPGTLDELGRNPAVALVVDRARRVRPEFELSPDNATAVAAICARLDGLPLALELAAARLRMLTPAALLARLIDASGGPSLSLLTDGPRDLPRRQQTLRDAIAWSYELLAYDEQQLFRWLSVFAGGCTLEALEAVCEFATRERRRLNLVDTLAALVDSSLLQQEIGPDEQPRYSMLETIRAFAYEQLVSHGEEAELRRQHARYFLALLESAGALLFAGQRKRQQFDGEQPNIQAALRWLMTHD